MEGVDGGMVPSGEQLEDSLFNLRDRVFKSRGKKGGLKKLLEHGVISTLLEENSLRANQFLFARREGRLEKMSMCD